MAKEKIIPIDIQRDFTMHDPTEELLEHMNQNCPVPMVVDSHPTPMDKFPKHCIV